MPDIKTQTRQPRAQQRFFALLARQLIALAAVCTVLWILQDRFAAVDLAAVKSAVASVGAQQWALAAIATLASFLAVGRYDAVLHGLLGTNIAARDARRSGMMAIATAQFAGFGILTGALVRWRMLPQMSLWQATRLSLAVSMSFLAGWGVFTAILLLFLPSAPVGLRPVAAAVTICAVGLASLSIWQPSFLLRLPSVRAMATVVVLAVIDTSCAGFALWALLPADLLLSPIVLAPAFLIALGAGLVGGTPGGVGPFELAMLTMLPTLPADPLIGAILAFRLVYYLTPALMAALWLMKGGAVAGRVAGGGYQPPFNTGVLSSPLETEIWTAPLAEAALLRQGELGLVRSARGIASAAVETGQSLVVYRSPLTKGTPDFDWLRNLDGIARRRHLAPMLYKCAPQHAAVARRYGWAVMRVSDEAVLSPATFNATIPACRQLRRMLRKATSAGVTVTSAGRRLPIAEMTAVSANWVRENGHERGVFMGRFHPDVLLAQRVFLAYRDARLVGFVSFNEVAAEWSLDLMRQSPDAPDGTIHLLVTEAIAQAAACGAPRLSLASVPRDRAFDTWLPAFVQSRLSVATGAPGLRQFKSCFAPVWEPLYAAAPTRFGLVWGLAEVARAINRPKRR